MSIVAALLALPKLVGAIDRLGATLDKLERSRVENDFNEIRGKVNEITARIENCETDEGRRSLVAELNNLISR